MDVDAALGNLAYVLLLIISMLNCGASSLSPCAVTLATMPLASAMVRRSTLHLEVAKNVGVKMPPPPSSVHEQGPP